MSLTTPGRELQALLELRLLPVAIAFRESAPANMQRIETPAPAGCGYWRKPRITIPVPSAPIRMESIFPPRSPSS